MNTLRTLARETVEKELDDWGKDVVSLQCAMIDLNSKQYALKTRLNTTTPFMSKLALEIKTHIFDLVTRSQNMSNARLLPAPLLLGKICKGWREIVWTTPCLWSFVRIHLNPRRLSTQKRLLREWLNRSGNSPLHYFISFSTKMTASSSTSLMIKSIIALIYSTSSRWRTFVAQPFPALADGQQLQLPNLTSIDINGTENDKFDKLKLDFSQAPLLRKVRLSGCGLLNSTTLCWNRLVVITLHPPFLFEDAATIISRLQAVQKLDIRIEKHTLRSVTTMVPVVPHKLPDLALLCIAAIGDDISSLLSRMITPTLTKLEITQLDANQGHLWVRAVEQLHERSQFPLSHLSLTEPEIGECDLASMLWPLSSLDSFSLSTSQSFKLSNDMINHLTNGKFLPNLTSFNYTGSISFTVEAFGDMIEQRCVSSHIKNLKALNITYKNDSWASNEAQANPNQLQSLYRKIYDIQSFGVTLNLVWDEDIDMRDSDSSSSSNSSDSLDSDSNPSSGSESEG